MSLSPRRPTGRAGASRSESTDELVQSQNTDESFSLQANALFSGTSTCDSPISETEYFRQLSLLQDYCTGVIDFINQTTNILYKLVLFKCILIVLAILPISMLFVGNAYRNDCPEIHMLPIYLSVGGCCSLLKIAFILLRHRELPSYEQLDDQSEQDGGLSEDIVLYNSVKFTDFMLNIFLVTWFILGNTWYYANPKPTFIESLHEPNAWCDAFLYQYYIYMLLVTYVLFSFIFIYVAFLICYFYKRSVLKHCQTCLL